MANYSGALLYSALALATFLAFAGSLGNEFVSFDDYYYIVNNPHVANGLTFESVRWAFTSWYASNWHPLTWLSHTLDCEVFGLAAWGHHLVNLLFHIASVLLLLRLLLKTTGRLWASFFVAAVFALHPLRVESVAWAAERKDVLSVFFLHPHNNSLPAIRRAQGLGQLSVAGSGFCPRSCLQAHFGCIAVCPFAA